MQALVCRIADGSDDSIEAMTARLAKLAAFVSRTGNCRHSPRRPAFHRANADPTLAAEQ
jgi:hypothetical protein